ncbi:MAG: MerR family transcriptional regulator [bacterium]
MTIGKAAKSTGLSRKAIRYYEDKGLLAPRSRTEGGYRQYEEADVNRLLFIRRAKELGISLRQIADLLNCWPDNTCSMTRPALKKAMRDRMDELKSQIELLSGLRNQLELELSELDKRPFSDHSQGFCNCLGGISGLISIEEIGNGNN